jgi:hypothetical protein
MGTRLPPAPPRRPGYEPAKGFPDPRATVIPASGATHAPNPNGGLICGRPAPTSAASYDAENPTCPDCALWLAKTRAHTDRIYGRGGLLAQADARAAAAAAEAAGETEDP